MLIREKEREKGGGGFLADGLANITDTRTYTCRYTCVVNGRLTMCICRTAVAGDGVL